MPFLRYQCNQNSWPFDNVSQFLQLIKTKDNI